MLASRAFCGIMNMAARIGSRPIRIRTHLRAALIKTGEKGECEPMTTRVCLRCGEEYQPTGHYQKFCAGCKAQSVIDGKAVYWAIRYATHHEKELARSAATRVAHPERKKKWYAVNRESAIEYSCEWAVKNPEKVKFNQAAWVIANPDKVRTNGKRMMAMRRGLGFIPINQPFDGCEGHHLNQNDVVYVPHKLHRSISHNVLTGRGMEKINALALSWLAESTGGIT